jgi:hypothetical protein
MRRFNAVDVALALLFLVLIPGAYLTYILFRTPPPRLVAVVPPRVYQGQRRVELRGQHLRPYLRVGFNLNQAPQYFFASPDSAQVDLPDLPPGVYEVELFDEMQALDTLHAGLTVLPNAPATAATVEATGTFRAVPEDIAATLAVGAKFPPSGEPIAEIVALGAPAPARLPLSAGAGRIEVSVPGGRDLEATLRVRCAVRTGGHGEPQCVVPGPAEPAVLEPNALITLERAGRWVSFQISAVRAAP